MAKTIGFQPDFLGKKNLIKLPQPTAHLLDDIKIIENAVDNLIHHHQYSVLLSKNRKLAIFSSANVDAKLKQKINRSELTSSWKVEKNLAKTDIVGNDLYKKSGMKLERGHLTPADVMEWGADIPDGKKNANDTFFFSNAAPQIKRLNGQEWGHLERFLGEESMKTGNSRLAVHTGCVFMRDDPQYIFEINGEKPQIPRYFWKVIYYLDKNSELCRIGFLMGQEKLLEKSELTEPTDLEAAVLLPTEVKEAFADLKKEKVFQVNIGLIEKLTNLKFSKANDKIADDRRLEVGSIHETDLESFNINNPQGEKTVLTNIEF